MFNDRPNGKGMVYGPGLSDNTPMEKTLWRQWNIPFGLQLQWKRSGLMKQQNKRYSVNKNQFST